MNIDTPSRANANLRGTLWMILAGAAFASSNVSVRLASEEIHPFVIVFLRSGIAVLLFARLFTSKDFQWLPREGFRLHMFRGVLQATALLCLYAGIAITPIATVIAIGFVTPIITAAGAILFLGEPSRLNRWLAVLLGFSGVLVIMRPGLIAITLGATLVIAYAVQQAASNLAAKELTKTTSSVSVVAWMTLISAPITLVPAIFVWQWPSPYVWALVAANAVLSTIAHLATTQAYRLADITFADPLMFFRMIMAAALGYFIFGEVPDLWTWAGSLVILAAAIILSREQRKEFA
ncbi:MAG: DMT family transporter [Rhodospirillales bacterium]|nr:DMT family transporter [Rhodospirillales bacterium]